MSGPGLKSKKVRLLLCYSLHYPQSPRIISPSEGLMWLLGLQNQNEKTGGFETGPSGDGRLTEHREPPFFFLFFFGLCKKQAFGGGTIEVPLWQYSSLSGISRVPANPLRKRGSRKEDLDGLAPGRQSIHRGEGLALAKGPLITS